MSFFRLSLPFLVFSLLMLSVATAWGSPATDRKSDDSETLQNAESASMPREIPIGLPESGTGSSIVEDGLILSHAVVRDYFHWAGGNSYSTVRVMGLTESIIGTGEVAMSVESLTRTGGDRTTGLLDFKTSNNGLIRFDGNFSGAMSKKNGWYYSFGAFVNMDPTSVNAPSKIFVDNKQIYKLCITKKWKRSQLDLMGKFSYCLDPMPGSYSSAPFVYNGDGTIGLYNGFRLGRDCYYPGDDNVTFKDVRTGETREGSLSKMNDKLIGDLHVNWRHALDDGWSIGASLQFCWTPKYQSTASALGGVVDAASSSYSFYDGIPLREGKVQLRSATLHDMGCNDLLCLFNTRKKMERNTLNMGFQGSFATQFQYSSTFYYAHTVSPNPVRLTQDGKATWKFNNNSLFYENLQYDFSLFATDDWDITDRWFLRGGFRIMLPFFNVRSAANRIDPESGKMQTDYNRYDGFSIKDLLDKGTPLSLITQKDIDGIPLDYHFSAYTSYKIAEGLFVMGEGFFSSVNKTSGNLKGNRIPSMKPIRYAFGSAGLSYSGKFHGNKSLDLRLVGSYISNWNNAAINTISNPSGSQVNSFVAEYGIGTLGVTFDGNLTLGGFSLHTLVNWRDPRYKNYAHTEHFDDGSTITVNYSGNFVVAIPQWHIELDPSYSWPKWKITANIRYFSRQYASANNFAYFNGHFETFGSVSWKCSKSCSLSLSIINMLFQYGAKGSVSASDAATSEEELAGIVMSGTYIRPFTVDLGLKIKI